MPDRLKLSLPPLSDATRLRQAMTWLRAGTGCLLLAHGSAAWSDPQFAGKLSGLLEAWAQGHPFDFYRDWLLAGALPHIGLVSAVWTLAVLFAGFSLLSGFLVVWGAPVAFMLALNYFLAAQHTAPDARILGLAGMLTALALYWGRAGQAYGLDAWIFRLAAAPADLEAPRKKGKPTAPVGASQRVAPKSRRKPRSRSKPF